MDWHFRRGDNAEFHPVAVHRQNRNRNTIANGDGFSTLTTENQHVSFLRDNKRLRTVVSDERYSTPWQTLHPKDVAEHPIRSFLIASYQASTDVEHGPSIATGDIDGQGASSCFSSS